MVGLAFVVSGLVLSLFAGVEPAEPPSYAVTATINKAEAEKAIQDKIDARQREVRRATRAKPRPRVPSLDELIYQPQGRQSFFKLKDNQRYNASVIIRTGRKMGLPYRALVIAIGTALQESHLNNYGNLGARNDHDSLGLFQQRPSTGWGKPSQIMNPVYSSTAFYKSLLKVRGWHSLPLTVAAQRVQRSAFPFAYAKWERMAAQIVRGYFQ